MVSAGDQTYEKGDVELVEFDGPDDEADHIATRIEKLIGDAVQRPARRRRARAQLLTTSRFSCG